MICVAALMLVATTACSKGDKASPSNPGEPQASNGIVSGKVVDQHGNPVSGATVYAGHTEWYNTNVIGKSDAGGNYRLDISNVGGTYMIHGELIKTYNGIPYRFYLYPDDETPVNSTDGGVRKITWRLSGTVPGTLNSKIGGIVNFHQAFGNEEYWSFEDIELTLTPVGKLVDGSDGAVIKSKAQNFAEIIGAYNNIGLNDVPVGRYKISAKYIPQNGEPVNLVLKLRDDDSYTAELTADFQQEAAETFQEIPMDIKFP
jgi:hypothetical protein